MRHNPRAPNIENLAYKNKTLLTEAKRVIAGVDKSFSN